MKDQIVFTIGHLRYKIDYFIELLNEHQCNIIIDVKSQPYSRIVPQFNKEKLRSTLKNNGIIYAHFEREFVAKHTNPSLLDQDGKVDFDKVSLSPYFK